MSIKKFLQIILIFSVFQLPTMADDVFEGLDTTNYGDVTGNLKPFTEKQYEDAIQQYKNKFQKPKKVKQKDIKTYTTPTAESETNPEFQVLETVLNHKGSIMIPTNCYTENGQEISPGYYTLEFKTDKDNYGWLILSQGSTPIAKIRPYKSNYNAGEDTINYAYALGKNNIIKLLYGNIDVAVEADLEIAN